MRVLTCHDGWVWDVAFDPENEWFATASADQTINVWGLANGELKLTLTGHKMPVRSLAVSEQLPYMFSGSEDNQALCWDLEHNSVVRSYHGHRSGIYSVALHPEIPYILATGSRDCSVRIWDVRTRAAIHVLTDHSAAVNVVKMQADEPQIISGGQNGEVRFWDLAGGKCETTLTSHERSVRSILCHPTENSLMTAGRDAIRKWALPRGEPIGTIDQNDTVYTLNYMDDKLYTGHENGEITVYDYNNGETIKTWETPAAVLCSAIDASGTRLVTGHMDKAVRVYTLGEDGLPRSQDKKRRRKVLAA